VVLRLKEQLSLGNARPVQSVDATVTDINNGKVAATLTKNMVNVPGIYYGEMALVSFPDGEPDNFCVVFSNTFYVIINRSTFSSAGDQGGPPSIAEIRLHLRDSSPTESYLLEHVMFDDAEIALAIARPVMYWNEILLRLIRNTQHKTSRSGTIGWKIICGNLFMMVAEQFRSNQLSYSAGGINVDDRNKEASYERAGEARWQAYREWVRAT
jgi:hypothetical protein